MKPLRNSLPLSIMTTRGAKPHRRLGRNIPLAAAIVAMPCFAASSVHAASSTWLSDVSGTWNDTSMWSNGNPASGTGVTADFSHVDLTAARTIDLDVNLTLGGLLFADTASPGTTNTWTISSANSSVLGLATSDGSSPTISVGAGFVSTINVSLSGTQGFTKTGNGQLTLLGGKQLGLTGDINVSAGTLRLSSSTTLSSASQLIINSGATVNLAGATTTVEGLSGGGTLNNSSNARYLIVTGSGTYTFSGAITYNTTSNTAGIMVSLLGGGMQILSGANNYYGVTTVNSGILKGTQTSGTPFGRGIVTINGGTLMLAPTGSGADVSVTGASGTSTATFTYGGSGTLSLNKGANNSLTYTTGSTGGSMGSVVRSGYGTLVIATSGSGSLGSTEKFIVNSTTTPTVTNGMVSASIVGYDSVTRKGNFLTYDATNGFKAATYSLSNTFTGSDNTKIVDITNAISTGGAVSAYALRTSAVINNTGYTLTLGGSAAGEAGLILNGGSISGGSLAFASSNEGLIYTNEDGGSISASLVTNGAITTFGPGVLTLSGSATRNGATNATTVNGGTLKITNANALYAAGKTSGTVTVNAGAAFELAGIDYSAGGSDVAAIVLAGNDAALRASGGTTIYNKASGNGIVVKNLSTSDGSRLSVNIEAASATDVLDIRSGIAATGGTTSLSAPLINISGLGTVLLSGSANSTGVTTGANGYYSWDVNGGGKLLVTSTSANPLGVADNTVKVSNGTLGLGSDNTTNYTYLLNGGTLAGVGGGIRTIDADSTIVLNAGTTSTIDLKDAGIGATENMNLVYDGVISGSGNIKVDASGSGSGKLTLGGSNTYTGTTAVNGGELEVNGSLAAGSAVTVKSGAVLSGSGTVHGTVGVTGGTVRGNGLSMGAVTFSGGSTLSGTTSASSYTVSSGTTTASGHATTTGTLSVAMGATFNNTGFTEANTVNVISGATLTNDGTLKGFVNVFGVMKGTGTVDGSLIIKDGGELAPGSSPGTQTITGNLTVESGAKLSIQLDSLTSYDQLVVNGAVALAGVLDLTIGTVADGDVFTIILNNGVPGISGSFSSVTVSGSTVSLSNGSTFTVGDYLYSLSYTGGSGNDLTLTVDAVPEPATWAMIASGVGILVGIQRFRCRRMVS